MLLVLLCGVISGARAGAPDAVPGAGLRPGRGVIVLAQLTQAQSLCASTCGKKCDADNRACTMNGKAPQIVVNSTCSPHYSDCQSKCTASCYKQ
jgi:hypothetical protein